MSCASSDIIFTNDLGNVPFVIITIPCFPHSWTCHRFSNKSNTMDGTCGAGTTYPSGTPEFTPCFWWGSYARFSVWCIVDRCLFSVFWSLCCLSFDLRLRINPLGSSNFWSNCRPVVGRSRSRNIILYNMYVWWMILYYILRCYALSWTKQRECVKLNKIDINDIIIHVLVYQPIFLFYMRKLF